ncbi:MAG: class I SAM-dependent methyltransferase [Planctomycetes bacterium]|nr:class I SAM-dependent methyltransferase [Planctomycetota bacterium]
MEIEKAYVALSRLISAWVALVEYHTRLMEAQDSDLRAAKILIISAPTDRGIVALTEANCQGESFLLCFTAEIEAIAQEYCRRRGITNIVTVVAPFFTIPYDEGEFDAVYANCLFDFCDPSNIPLMVEEIWRVLKQRGRLHSVHMGQPSRRLGRVWAWFFRRFPVLSGGCHPVSVAPLLLDRGFRLVRADAPERFGFPLRYTQAEKPKVA